MVIAETEHINIGVHSWGVKEWKGGVSVLNGVVRGTLWEGDFWTKAGRRWRSEPG